MYIVRFFAGLLMILTGWFMLDPETVNNFIDKDYTDAVPYWLLGVGTAHLLPTRSDKEEDG